MSRGMQQRVVKLTASRDLASEWVGHTAAKCFELESLRMTGVSLKQFQHRPLLRTKWILSWWVLDLKRSFIAIVVGLMSSVLWPIPLALEGLTRLASVCLLLIGWLAMAAHLSTNFTNSTNVGNRLTFPSRSYACWANLSRTCLGSRSSICTMFPWLTSLKQSIDVRVASALAAWCKNFLRDVLSPFAMVGPFIPPLIVEITPAQGLPYLLSRIFKACCNPPFTVSRPGMASFASPPRNCSRRVIFYPSSRSSCDRIWHSNRCRNRGNGSGAPKNSSNCTGGRSWLWANFCSVREMLLMAAANVAKTSSWADDSDITDDGRTGMCVAATAGFLGVDSANSLHWVGSLFGAGGCEGADGPSDSCLARWVGREGRRSSRKRHHICDWGWRRQSLRCPLGSCFGRL